MRFKTLGCVLATAGLLAGCGGKEVASSPTPTIAAAKATPTPTPAFTSPDDLAACAQLQQTVQAVSLVVGHTTEDITQALHPKELAEKIGTAQKSLLDSANVVAIARPPKELVRSQRDFVKGLRMFAADFGRGKISAANGDMAKATEELTDEVALRKIQVSAKRIDDMCGA
jgi:hypothetical protein